MLGMGRLARLTGNTLTLPGALDHGGPGAAGVRTEPGAVVVLGVARPCAGPPPGSDDERVSMPAMMRTLILTLSPILEAAALTTGLSFTAPRDWKTVATTSAMRVAQYMLPGAEGAEGAELVIYYFGGSGGTVEANIARWLGQMQQPDGRPSSAVAKRETRTVNGLRITLVDVSGTYVAEVRPGSGQRHDSPNFRLRAAVVETPKGPYFIKLTGPATTVAAHEQAFDQFLSSAKWTEASRG